MTDTQTPQVIEAQAREADADEPKSTDVEHVEQPAASALPARVDERSLAIERAADEAATSIIAGRDEFLSLAQQARILSMSGLAPKQVRGNPYVAFHIALIGRDMQLSPTAALELVDIIGEGEDARPSLSPELMLGRIKKMGLGQIKPLMRSLDRCVAVALSIDWRGVIDEATGKIETHDGHILGTTEFTWDDATIAGLVDTRCASPRDHWLKPNGDPKRYNDRCDCRQGWRTYPKRMLWWRAAGYCADDYFPEASIGLYSPEELGAVVDEHGHAIDPTTAELPDGYDKASIVRSQAAAAGEDMASDDELWRLQLDIRALPDEQRAELRRTWANHAKLKGIAVTQLTEPLARLVRSMLSGVQSAAKRAGWDQEESTLAVLADLAACVSVCFPAVTDELPATSDVPDVDPQPSAEPDVQPTPDEQLDEKQPEQTADETKPSCQLCGSARAELIEHRGVLRCRNATDCAHRVERRASQTVEERATQASLDEQQ